MARRATLFIDGNNWYHGLKGLGSVDLGRLDYRRLSLKLVGPRQWICTRYYIGRVPQSGDVTLYTSQRRFLAKLESEPRISTHLGRLEPRPATNPTAHDLRSYLSNLRTKIDFRVFQDLMRLARRQQKATVLVEKAVDVMLAVDLVVMAERDDFDDAYLLSADGDFTPAVEHVRSRGNEGVRGLGIVRGPARRCGELVHTNPCVVVVRRLLRCVRCSPRRRGYLKGIMTASGWSRGLATSCCMTVPT